MQTLCLQCLSGDGICKRTRGCEVFSVFLPVCSVSFWSHYAKSVKQLIAAAVSHWEVWWRLFRKVKVRFKAFNLFSQSIPACLQSTQRPVRHKPVSRITQCTASTIFSAWTDVFLIMNNIRLFLRKCHRVLFKAAGSHLSRIPHDKNPFARHYRDSFSCNFSVIVSCCFIPPCKACTAVSFPHLVLFDVNKCTNQGHSLLFILHSPFFVSDEPAPSSADDTDGSFNLFFFFFFCLLQAFIADNWQTIWEHQILR